MIIKSLQWLLQHGYEVSFKPGMQRLDGSYLQVDCEIVGTPVREDRLAISIDQSYTPNFFIRGLEHEEGDALNTIDIRLCDLISKIR